jgi:hypothetical protein
MYIMYFAVQFSLKIDMIPAASPASISIFVLDVKKHITSCLILYVYISFDT